MKKTQINDLKYRQSWEKSDFSFFFFTVIVPSVFWADDGLHVSIRHEQFNLNLLKTRRKNSQRLKFKTQNSQIQMIAFWCSDWNLWFLCFFSLFQSFWDSFELKLNVIINWCLI